MTHHLLLLPMVGALTIQIKVVITRSRVRARDVIRRK